MCLEIKPGALFISDAHYSQREPQFLNLLKSIDSGKIETTQLLLCGDIFDLLFKPIATTVEINIEAINLLNKISKRVEAIYLEGNHDFCLEGIFTDMQIIPLSRQPLVCSYRKQRVYVAHGDFNQPFSYHLYSKIIRNTFALKLLNVLDVVLKNRILNSLQSYLMRKNNHHNIEDFDQFVLSHIEPLKLESCDALVEGHYHQGLSFELQNGARYINLKAFVCSGEIGVVEDSEQFSLRWEHV